MFNNKLNVAKGTKKVNRKQKVARRMMIKALELVEEFDGSDEFMLKVFEMSETDAVLFNIEIWTWEVEPLVKRFYNIQ